MGWGSAQSHPRCTKCNSPPINGQCTNFILMMWHYNCLWTHSCWLLVLSLVYKVITVILIVTVFIEISDDRSLLNRFRTDQGHCGACRRKWQLTDTDLCPCDETQTMSHIVESCPLTKLNGGLSRLHSADEDAVSWLTNYGK